MSTNLLNYRQLVMKLQRLLVLSAISLAIAACTGQEAATNPSPTSPEAQSPVPTESIEATAESAPTVAQAPVKSGTFTSGEHPTQGTVRIVMQNGSPVLELGDDFQTSEMGPDLVVILHRSDDVIGSTEPPAYPLQEGDYIFLAELQEFRGAQSYPIPADVNLADYQSVVIWCRRFNATFGAATLQ